jgi:hypothetical protein
MLRALLCTNPSADEVSKLLEGGQSFKEAVTSSRPGRNLPLRIALQKHSKTIAELLHKKAGAAFNAVDLLGPLLLEVLRSGPVAST